MKYSVLIVSILLIMFLCECSTSNDTSTANEYEKLLDNVVQATADLWKDVKNATLIEDHRDNKTSIETGRGKKTKMEIPLMLGFKIAAVVVTALAGLKVLLVQALFVSTLALAAALVLGFKTLYEHLHSHLYKTTDISFLNAYGLSSLPAYLGFESSPSHHESVLYPGTTGYAYYNPAEDATGEEHYSPYHAAQNKNSTALDRLYSAGVRRPIKNVHALKTIIRKTTNLE